MVGIRNSLKLILTDSHSETLVAATFIKCGGTSAHRTLTFKNPDKLPETCVYKFKPTSSRVCKIKFEFNALSLAPPSYVPFPKCVNDELATDVISICGENPGQHSKC